MNIIFWEIPQCTEQIIDLLKTMNADILFLYCPNKIEEDLSEHLGSPYDQDTILCNRVHVYYKQDRLIYNLSCQISNTSEGTFVFTYRDTQQSYIIGLNHDYMCDVSITKGIVDNALSEESKEPAEAPQPMQDPESFYSFVNGKWQPYYFVSLRQGISASFHNKDIETWIEKHPEWLDYSNHLPVEFTLN